MHRRSLLRCGAPFLGVAAVPLAVAGCRMAPLQNDVAGEFVGPGTLTQRGDAIRRAGTGLGWVVEPRGPGAMIAMLTLRTHQVTVDIPYDQQRFSIRYVSSTNLNYDGLGNIHPNYNSWVQRLRNTIVAQPAI